MSNLMIGKKKKVAAFIKKFLKNSSLLLLEQKKKRSEKVFFIATNNWIVLAVRKSVKNDFAPNSPLFRKSGGEEKKKIGKYEALWFSSKRNKIEDNNY